MKSNLMTDALRGPFQMVRLSLVAPALLGASACSVAAGQTQSPQPVEPPFSSGTRDTRPVLRPGDMLNIQVWRQEEYSGEFEVTGNGTIGHPLYRQVQAAGREVADVEEDLHVLLTRYLGEPNFLVEGFFRVAVGGEVRSPDIYALTAQTTVARAIAHAGGPTQRARVDRVILRRDGKPFVLDLTNPDVRQWDLEVRSGDEIVVERRVDVFREYVAPSAAIVGAVAAVLRLII